MKIEPQFFPYECPDCHRVRNASDVARELDYAVLITEMARRRGRRQTPHAGPGRPSMVRCPGCEVEMSSSEAREHRIPCVRNRLQGLRTHRIHLCPKDPDPWRDFRIDDVRTDEVVFEKLSSTQRLPIELRKVAEITIDSYQHLATIRLHGRVAWDGVNWALMPVRLAAGAT